MLVADLRALNAELHAFLRAADGGYTRRGYGHPAGCYDVDLNYTIHTNDTFTETTYTDEQNITPIKCISSTDKVKAFFEATPADGTPIRANVMESPKFVGRCQVGAIHEVEYSPYSLEFEKIYNY
jgi:hypothetical protein